MELTRRIITFVKENPVLYINSIGYKDETLRAIKWRELAAELKVSRKQIKKVWKSLKTSFFELDQKEKDFVYRGIPFQTKWIYYNDLSFLREISITPTLPSNITSDEDLFKEGHKYNPNSVTPPIFIKQENVDENDENPDFVLQSNSTDQCVEVIEPSRKKRRGNNFDNEHILKSPNGKENALGSVEVKRKKSAISTFFESIAITIDDANLPLEEVLKLEQEILWIVTNRIIVCKNEV